MNSSLKEKNQNLENIVLFYMKERGELEDIDKIDDKFKNDKRYQEIAEMKYDKEILLNMIFRLKQENININQNLQQITVEANTRIRDLAHKAKKK